MDELYKQIEIEAYRIYKWRTFFNPPFPGNDKTDWFEAKDNIEEERRTRIITNRIGNYLC